MFEKERKDIIDFPNKRFSSNPATKLTNFFIEYSFVLITSKVANFLFWRMLVRLNSLGF